ncbi:MAG TPA: YidB family protein [Phenylobacterium sp.]|uniref:YidB family protein n=1 Tax=Phenylobacterium sp. TaxID=1871053 RepID=UPI002CEF3BF5|nr:YidB family protein [Phenylobacterium sp.]HSV03967.1 YidB family protein [Phenylobacterium sp.]
MGLLDSMLGGGQPQRKPGIGDTVAAGVVLALLVKAIRQHQASQAAAGQPGRSFDPGAPNAQPQAASGGLLGGLGGLLAGGGGLGGLLGGLGGAGALGALVSRFQQSGHGQQVGSWVGEGPNQPIAPHEVGQVLGDDTLNALQQKTGLSRQDLLSQLAHELPQAISAATPEGRVPQSDEELHAAARQPAPNA